MNSALCVEKPRHSSRNSTGAFFFFNLEEPNMHKRNEKPCALIKNQKVKALE